MTKGVLEKPQKMDQRRQNVRWDNHQSNLQTMFSWQLEQERFLDITLASQDGQTIKAHRAVLCAASGYFDTVLTNTTVGKETLVILKDINFDEIKQIIDFVYHGEISVEQVVWSAFSLFLNIFVKPFIFSKCCFIDIRVNL